MTNYQYASNEPIANVDLDGLEEFKVLEEVVVFKTMAPAAKAASATAQTLSIAAKAGVLLKSAGTAAASFGKNFWKEGVAPSITWFNRNLNPIYGIFNGINSQFTGQDFLTGEPMSRADGIGDVILSAIPALKVEGAIVKGVEKEIVRQVEKVAAKGGTKLITQFSTSTIDDAVGLIMKNPNKVAHLFNSKHNLGGLISKFGGQENTIRAVLNAANGKLPSSGIFNNVSVNIGGQNVFIRGSIINGTPRLGTMFIP